MKLFKTPAIVATMIFIFSATLADFALAGTTQRVSVDSLGNQGDGHSTRPSTSADGRYVAFHSVATNLVTGDTNDSLDVFVHDRDLGVIERVSVDSLGNEGNGISGSPSISADGRYVAFGSYADNLVAGDTNGASDIFVHDRDTGQTERVSVDSLGNQGNSDSADTSISADGRYVAFFSYADNLVTGDTNGITDVFVHDRDTGLTERVSVDSLGSQGESFSEEASISADGRYVAFYSNAENLVAGDTNGAVDVFVHDRVTGLTERVSVDSLGNQGNSHSGDPSISADGRYVGFGSGADNLVVGDTNGVADAFVHDRDTGLTERVSVDSLGSQGNSHSGGSTSTSADGRYVAFLSIADNLVAGDTNGAYDIFVHDRNTGQTERVSVDSLGNEGNGETSFPSISADGRYVAFSSSANNLVPGDTNSVFDVFVHDRGSNANQAPIAEASASPNPAECSGATTPIVLDGSASHDPDPGDSIVSWDWSGDASASGSLVTVNLATGTWNVNLTVEDSFGATGSDLVSILVQDTVPPSVTAGADATLEASSPDGAPYSLPYSVNDNCDPSPSFSVQPVLSTYPLGTTTVNLSANDSSGNSASDSAEITVVDTTPPDVTVPADIVEEATSSSGNAVSFSTSANDIVEGAITPSCTPLSGSLFPHGQTAVLCEAADGAGNTGSAGFNVIIENAPPVAHSQSVTLNENQPTSITLTGSDPDGFPSATLIFEIVSAPLHGSFSVTTPPLLTYSPETGYYGSDSFTFRAYDGAVYSSTMAVDISILPDNGLPPAIIDPKADVDPSAVIGGGSEIKKGAVVSADVVIGVGTLVDRDVFIGEGVLIGNHCTLSRGVEIGASSQLGDNVHLDRNVVVGDQVAIGDDVFVGKDSLIGDGVSIGADSTLGQNVVIDPGTAVPPGSDIPSGAHLP